MAEIRPLERTDLAAVTALLRAHMRNWSLDERILAAVTLDHPWSDPELPSLVATDDSGRVVGFIAAQARRMRFDDRDIRGVCCGDLIVDPEHRAGAGAPGAQLLSRLLEGPQDVTWSDSTSDAVARAWRALGGHVDHARATDFMLVLHPGRWLSNILTTRARGRHVGRRLAPVGSFPGQALGGWFTGRRVEGAAADVTGEVADVGAIIEALPAIMRRIRVCVAWDEAALGHFLALLQRVDGNVRCRLVRRRQRPIGWYAYIARRGGASRLLHLAAADNAVDAVVADLVADARSTGGAVLSGRAEPHLERPLRNRLAALGFAWQPVLRARDPELAATLATSSSLLTRLDGELTPY